MIKESTNESQQDISALQEAPPEEISAKHDESSAHIELFLKTATKEQMDVIRESLSHVPNERHLKNEAFTNIKADAGTEDNIEEELEEDIPEDTNIGEDSSSSEEEKL